MTDNDETPSTTKEISVSPLRRATENLKDALQQWDQLTKVAPRPSAEEQNLQEMRELLKSIQNKIGELGL